LIEDSDAHAVKSCRDAANAQNPNGSIGYRDSPLTVEALIRLVASAGDPIDVLDLTGTIGDPTHVLDLAGRPRNTGMIWADVAPLIQDNAGGQRVRA
jgi:hypothetical protein